VECRGDCAAQRSSSTHTTQKKCLLTSISHIGRSPFFYQAAGLIASNMLRVLLLVAIMWIKLEIFLTNAHGAREFAGRIVRLRRETVIFVRDEMHLHKGPEGAQRGKWVDSREMKRIWCRQGRFRCHVCDEKWSATFIVSNPCPQCGNMANPCCVWMDDKDDPWIDIRK